MYLINERTRRSIVALSVLRSSDPSNMSVTKWSYPLIGAGVVNIIDGDILMLKEAASCIDRRFAVRLAYDHPVTSKTLIYFEVVTEVYLLLRAHLLFTHRARVPAKRQRRSQQPLSWYSGHS